MKKHLQKNRNIRLVYFNFPFWRVDICKIALAIGKIPYENRIISRKYFIKNKETDEFPFGQVPVLIFKKIKIAQTGAMIRFCGKLSGLYPKDDIKCALVDQSVGFANDLTNLIIPSIREKNENKKKELREKLSKVVIPRWLGYLERFYVNHRESKYFLSKSLTIADIIIWRILLWVSSGKLEFIPQNILENFFEINSYFKNISDNKNINGTCEYKHILSHQTTL